MCVAPLKEIHFEHEAFWKQDLCKLPVQEVVEWILILLVQRLFQLCPDLTPVKRFGHPWLPTRRMLVQFLKSRPY